MGPENAVDHCDEIRTGERMRPPKFSVIVGIYNQAHLLPKLVEALQRQTFQDFDVHFCDDGSPDGSLEAAKTEVWKTLGKENSLGGRAFCHWQRNRGMRLAKSLNRGIRAAKGEHCVFIMGDSFPEPDYLETLAGWAQPTRVLCGVRIHVHEGRAVDLDWRLKKNKIPHADVLLTGNQIWSMMTGNGLCVPTWAMREYGAWNERIRGYGGDDYELIARLFYKGLTMWSIASAKLYHNWHPAQMEEERNLKEVSKLISRYAA